MRTEPSASSPVGTGGAFGAAAPPTSPVRAGLPPVCVCCAPRAAVAPRVATNAATINRVLMSSASSEELLHTDGQRNPGGIRPSIVHCHPVVAPLELQCRSSSDEVIDAGAERQPRLVVALAEVFTVVLFLQEP